jgi:hypothetical protein
VAPIPLIGLTSFDGEKLAKLPPAQMLGIAFLAAGLVILIWRITERKDESTVSGTDASLLREHILPPLNRQAILEADEEHEDLRSQFSGIRAARIALAENQSRLVSTPLKSTVSVLINLLKDIEMYSPWNDIDLKPNRADVWQHQKTFDEWYTERYRLRKPTPQIINGTFYGPMLTLIQVKLLPVRTIKTELELLSSMRNS